MKLKPQTALLLATVFVIAGVAATMATGLWRTDSDKTPRKLSATAAPAGLVEPSSTGATELPTQYDPADIRGSYTFGEISDLFGVPLADLAQAFGLTLTEADAFQAKSLESKYPDAA